VARGRKVGGRSKLGDQQERATRPEANRSRRSRTKNTRMVKGCSEGGDTLDKLGDKQYPAPLSSSTITNCVNPALSLPSS